MKLDPGTIVFWREFRPGQNKFHYILGVSSAREVLSFTISSQLKYLTLSPHKDHLIEVPYWKTDFLHKRSFVQCFYEVTKTPIQDFEQLEARGIIGWRCCMPELTEALKAVVAESELLSGEDRALVLDLLRS